MSQLGRGNDAASAGKPVFKRKEYVHRPIIRRTRSWRGIMQVRFNDTRADRNRIGLQAFIWAPARVFGILFLSTALIYYGVGHDAFLQTLLGYESEMQYEAKVNPSYSNKQNQLIDRDRGWRKPVRDLEKPLHPMREFDLMRDPKST